MRQELYQLLQGSGSVIGFEDAAIRVLVAAALGLVIFFSYWISHAGTIYSQKFNVTLVTLTVLTATVMMVIGSSIALSLGMVGALSIVRFRTAIKDARDTTYIFWAIICGICCGVAQFLAAAVGSAAVFFVLLLLGRIRNDVRTLIIIRASRIRELELEGRMYEVLGDKASLRVKNTTEESIELIYEINKNALDKAERASGTSLTDKLYAIENVDYVNIVAQNDEIGS
ncbi:DUF4956 domain-containing protein [Collinsella ihumii]|uniref:DUF4956 domain-containing protein n=1 Tax=Collinsella ihumii TaxID=1720204 RepID=A0AAW7JTC9_9ACTN|nr:DUF4956 domain-containing protein [Collinsella ihumii]MBM6904997.1 DUF4956 domain-containing protein [Collinsella tanakaei]MDN0068223.1 DUF4956 domain-containing protein [Collinsella ihumii]